MDCERNMKEKGFNDSLVAARKMDEENVLH